MAKLKVLIRDQEDQKTKDGTFNVKVRLTHKQKTRYLGTDYYVKENQIDDSGTVINHPNAAHYNIQLRNLLNRYDEAIIKLGGQLDAIEMRTLVSYLKDIDPYGRDNDFLFFASIILKEMEAEGRFSTVLSIKYSITLLKEFARSEVLFFTEITPGFLENYSRHLRYKGLSQNTIAMYLRYIRAIYNKAIDADKVSLATYPFRKFKIKQEKTRKRNLPVEDIKKIIDLRNLNKSQMRARDLFLLSFYLVGINFKDLLYAKNSDVVNGRLEYSRAKTKRLYSIKIEPEAQELINKYSGQTYLLSLMETKIKTAKDNRSTRIHKDIISQTNKQLKNIALANGFDPNISTYYGRRSWATIASSIGIPKDDISAALGHGQYTVTDTYINFDEKRIDRANQKVIRSLR